MRSSIVAAAALAAFASAAVFAEGDGAESLEPTKVPDVPYVPTPPAVVTAMLQLAQVKKGDLVYDLGCGDGRIVIEAAKRYGARGVGIDIDPERIEEARKNAEEAGVSDRVEFRQQDLFEVDLRKANVVTLYLLQSVNMKLRPRLLDQLKPGARVVSHAFDMGDWEPRETVHVEGYTAYLWVIPSKVSPELKRLSHQR
jgi:cyclopropane fatty-acyl-phospholipid synthase-like methyltransferase